MTETNNIQWLWQPPAPVSIDVLHVDGSAVDDKYPVNRVFCVGRNYEAHAVEMNAKIDREAPFYFTKTPSTIVSNVMSLPYPPGTTNFHHEVELVIALGGSAHEIEDPNLEQLVFGYAVGIDLTRRDLQNKAKADRKPWDLSKDFEQAAVISPIRQVANHTFLTESRIELRVNNEQRQSASLSQMVWRVPEIIAHLSRYYHLVPGDLIYTGTPAGVGPLEVGDRINASIEGIGELSLAIHA